MSPNKIRSLIISFLCCVFLVFLDQFTKFFAVSRLKYPDGSDIVIADKVFRLHYLENTGAAFSIMDGKQWFFIILTVFVCAILLYFYCRIPAGSKFLPIQACLVFLFSGAVGNLIDRIKDGFVVDFLYFELIDFPVFNVADIYVTCSVFVLFLLVMFKYKDADFEFLKISKKDDK